MGGKYEEQMPSLAIPTGGEQKFYVGIFQFSSVSV